RLCRELLESRLAVSPGIATVVDWSIAVRFNCQALLRRQWRDHEPERRFVTTRLTKTASGMFPHCCHRRLLPVLLQEGDHFLITNLIEFIEELAHCVEIRRHNQTNHRVAFLKYCTRYFRRCHGGGGDELFRLARTNDAQCRPHRRAGGNAIV